MPINKRFGCILLLFLTSAFLLFGQTHNAVKLGDNVYDLLQIAELKGLVSRLSQARPYSKSRINSLLLEIDAQRGKLTEQEQAVLDAELRKYAPEDRTVSPVNILEQGKIHINNNDDSLFPMAFGARFDFEERADLSNRIFSSVNTMEWFVEGDISRFLSYDIRVGAGINNIDSLAYAPYTYSKDGDGYLIALSGGLGGGGLVDGDQDGVCFSFLFKPELSTSFFNNRLELDWARYRRDIGTGEGNLMLSGTARPYDGIDLKLRPADWFNYYFSVGSLGNWFSGSVRSADSNDNDVLEDSELIFQNMFTYQMFEFMPMNWFYFSISDAVVWAKRLELSYMMPFMLPLFAQNLTGDQDNASIQLSLAFKIPFGLEIFGNAYADELRFNTSLFSDPAVQLALQTGIKGVIPGLPFTLATFQYTRLDPYVYTHYAQEYPFFDSNYYFDISWTNDGENLGYYLPPNSDEFLFLIKSLPAPNLTLFAKYQYIRHGEGNWEEGDMEGDTSAGGDGEEPAHAYHSTGIKDFLHDGVYEKIHIGTIGASYEVAVDYIPLSFDIDYSFVYGKNIDNIEGNTRIKNILGLKIHLFPGN